MKRFWLALVAVALVVAACGGDESGSESGSDSDNNGDDGVIVDEQFDESDLPSDFPPNLIPPDYEEGIYAELGGVRTASFEGGISYEDAVDYYTSELGPANIEVGEEGMRLVQWTEQAWIVSIFEEDGPLIGISNVDELES